MTGMDNVSELMVPENGLIALNVPLDETRVGSFSTRTTHPFYLSLWNKLLLGLGLNMSVVNPYWNKTKAIEIGCYFSINPGMLKTKSGLEIIKKVPLDRILVETDAPFALKVKNMDGIEQELNRIKYLLP